MRFLLILICVASFAQDAQPTFYADLSGPWRISPDDNPRYAEPAFDDTNWATANLPWDHERLLGVYWLRRSIALPAGSQMSGLTLAIGSVNETYELYVNGSRVGVIPGFGTDDPLYFQPRTFAIPEVLLSSGRLVVALRIWRPKRVVWIRAEYSVDLGPYLCASDLAAQRAVEHVFLQRLLRRSSLAITPLYLLLGLYLLWISRSDREWRELKWLGASMTANFAGNMPFLLLNLGLDNTWTGFVTANSALGAFTIGFFTEFTLAALRISPGVWRIVAWLPLPLAFVPPSFPGSLISPALLPAVLCLLCSLTAVVRRSQPLMAGVIASYAVVRINLLAAGFNASFLPTGFSVGPSYWPTTTVLTLTIGSTLAVLSLKRLLRDKNEKQRLASEVAAARQVQEMLLSNTSLVSAGYSVEAVYHPAQEVGGDFYQILQCDDGALVIVVGDVSGKGLRAAMLVSMIAGIIKREDHRLPDAILNGLNRVLTSEMQGGFVTCCCVRLETDGSILIANAGHPSPYIDGNEVDVAPGLPLGVSSDAGYETTHHSLAPGAQLTLISDGVVEAANPSGELFGFERTRELSGKSAHHIATTAQAFGQNDDITVVTIRRRA